MSRIETGRLRISEADLHILMNRYGVKDRSLRGYIGYESDVAEMHSAQTTLVPSLLQTHDYAAAIFYQQRPDATDRREQLEIRDKRREVFGRPRPLVFWGVISESVFRHAIGGPEVMAAQLEYLLSMARDYPNTINIHVLPEASESHTVLFGPFVILSFPQRREPEIVYLDGFTSTKFKDAEMVQNSIADASTIDIAWRRSSFPGRNSDSVELAPYQNLIAPLLTALKTHTL